MLKHLAVLGVVTAASGGALDIALAGGETTGSSQHGDYDGPLNKIQPDILNHGDYEGPLQKVEPNGNLSDKKTCKSDDGQKCDDTDPLLNVE